MKVTKLLAAGLCTGLTVMQLAAAPQKQIYAHYMTCFSSSPAFYEREVSLAKMYGIDGFALNCGEWKHFFDTNNVTATSREFNSPGYPGYIYIGFRIAK